jgi:hypothetical protein
MVTDFAIKLMNMQQKDEEKREQLKAEGRLYNNRYEEDMKAVHEANAEELASYIAERGWPCPDTDGEKACTAAYLIAQHAVSKPDFQKNCLKYMKQAIMQGKGDLIAAAYLEDRLLQSEGKPQIYGTQHIVDQASNRLAPYRIQDPDNVDVRRAKIKLGSLAEKTAELNFERTESLTTKNLPTPKNE